MSVALRYHLRRQCTDQFCRYCENTFKQSICFPKCTEGPTVICLRPRMPVRLGEGNNFTCLQVLNAEGEVEFDIANVLQVTVSGTADNIACAASPVGSDYLWFPGFGTSANGVFICTMYEYVINTEILSTSAFYWRGQRGPWTVSIAAQHSFRGCRVDFALVRDGLESCYEPALQGTIEGFAGSGYGMQVVDSGPPGLLSISVSLGMSAAEIPLPGTNIGANPFSNNRFYASEEDRVNGITSDVFVHIDPYLGSID